MAEIELSLQGGPVGIIADDLTGAGDTALAFHAPGREVWIVPELGEAPRAPRNAQVVALNTESRHLLPEQAAGQVDRAVRYLQRAGCTRFYKKLDSTLRGNLAAEILQAQRSLECDLAVVAPAFPSAGRQTVGGYQLIDGVPVSASTYARDPLAPVHESHLPSLLSEDGVENVGLIALRTVLKGPEAIAGAFAAARAADQRVLVVDAARSEDLAAIVRAIAMVPYRVLPVGSAGLAQALQPRVLLGPAPAGELLLAQRPPVLVVAGSLNPTTIQQVRELARTTRVVPVDVQDLLLTESSGRDRLIASVLPALLARQDVVLATALAEDAARKGRELGRDLAMGAMQTGHQLVTALGAVVARLVAEAELSGLILAGGETSLGICKALGSPPMRVLAELLPAIPLCRVELANGPLQVVTKSGGFGAPDALRQLTERLKRVNN